MQPSLSFIQLQVRIGDTVCYRFRPDDNQSDGGGTVRISYLGLSSVYNVVNAYDFSLAAAEVRCLCNCPGGANTCDADTQRLEGIYSAPGCAKFVPAVARLFCLALSWVLLINYVLQTFVVERCTGLG